MIPRYFLLVLVWVESHGVNTIAIHHGHVEVGVLQITRPVVEDVNRISGRHYDWSLDCLDREKSLEIATIYLEYWGSRERLHRQPTPEDWARIWNGGPHGWKHPLTDRYWQKVQEAEAFLSRS